MQSHMEELQVQVYQLQLANHDLLKANGQCVDAFAGLHEQAEGLNLEIDVLQIQQHPRREGFA